MLALLQRARDAPFPEARPLCGHCIRGIWRLLVLWSGFRHRIPGQSDRKMPEIPPVLPNRPGAESCRGVPAHRLDCARPGAQRPPGCCHPRCFWQTVPAVRGYYRRRAGTPGQIRGRRRDAVLGNTVRSVAQPCYGRGNTGGFCG